MLLTKCTYVVFLHIYIHLIQSILLCAIYLRNEYIYFKIASLCLFNEFLILIVCTSSFFVYFYWPVPLLIFCFYSEILSQPFSQSEILKDCFVWLQQSGSHFWLLVQIFYMYQLQVKFVLCAEFYVLFLVLFQRLLMNLFGAKYILYCCVCTTSSIWHFGLNSSINKYCVTGR